MLRGRHRSFITKDMINTAKRQILLDVGINRKEDANSEIYDIPTLDYTPVPGGLRVGLLENISSLR